MMVPDRTDAHTAEENLSNEPLDARVLAIDYNAVGEKHKEWKVVSIEVKEYQWEDWPLEGPLSLGHLVPHFNSFGGDPKRWLGEWMRAKGVQDNDRIAHEMRCLVECLYIAGCYDQLNLCCLASLEVIARRLQGIVDAYSSGSPSNPDWQTARIITSYKGPDDAIAPSLRTWAARRNKGVTKRRSTSHSPEPRFASSAKISPRMRRPPRQ